jgi:hypothetical protein
MGIFWGSCVSAVARWRGSAGGDMRPGCLLCAMESIGNASADCGLHAAPDERAARPHLEWGGSAAGVGGDNRGAGERRGSTSQMSRRAQRAASCSESYPARRGREQGKAPPSMGFRGALPRRRPGRGGASSLRAARLRIIRCRTRVATPVARAGCEGGR